MQLENTLNTPQQHAVYEACAVVAKAIIETNATEAVTSVHMTHRKGDEETCYILRSTHVLEKVPTEPKNFTQEK